MEAIDIEFRSTVEKAEKLIRDRFQIHIHAANPELSYKMNWLITERLFAAYRLNLMLKSNSNPEAIEEAVNIFKSANTQIKELLCL